MDYFFLSSLRQNAPKRIFISYDIACQWSKHLDTRSNIYPSNLSIEGHSLQYFIPKWHMPAHQKECHANFSFHFTPWVGRTDGEAPERGWAAMNGLATSTKEMGPGSRRDTLDDHFGDYNWRKTVLICMSLLFLTCNLHHITVRLPSTPETQGRNSGARNPCRRLPTVILLPSTITRIPSISMEHYGPSLGMRSIKTQSIHRDPTR